MNGHKTTQTILLLCLMLLLSGCRTRTTGLVPENPGSVDSAQNQGIESETQSGLSSPPSDAAALEDSNLENTDPGGMTRENPEASRKEYDENAPAEIVPGTEHLLHAPGSGAGLARSDPEAEQHANQLDSQAGETATQTVAADEAEKTGVSEDAPAADSAMTYFTVLLQDTMDSVFECKRAYVYWETAQDHVTIHKTSPEHALILSAGQYDVSARLLPENLQVDDGWVVRKNPGVIVKIVDSQVLGSRVGTTHAAESVCAQLLSREGWTGIDAARNRRILLLSQELLDAPYLQTAAMLMIAVTACPEEFPGLDMQEALQMLTQEATGELPSGIYYYHMEE